MLNGQEKRVLLPIGLVHAPPALLRSLKRDTVQYEELKESVRKYGILMNIVVRESPAFPGDYEVADGLHRWSVAKDLGLRDIPAVVKNVELPGLMGLQIVGNAVRIETTDIEYSDALRRILRHHEEAGVSLTVPELCAMVCKSKEWVTRRLKLQQLHPKVREAMEAGKILLGHGVALSRLPPGEQLNWLKVAVNNSVKDFELVLFRHMAQFKAELLTERELSLYGGYTPRVRSLTKILHELEHLEYTSQTIAKEGITDPMVMAVRILEWVVNLDEEARKELEKKFERGLTQDEIRSIIASRKYEELERIEHEIRNRTKRDENGN